MTKQMTFKWSNYDGGLPSHSKPEAKGKLVLVPGGKWELHYSGGLGRRDRWVHGGIQRYPFDVTETGPNSCHVTIRDIRDPAIAGGFDLPNTASSALQTALQAQRGSVANSRKRAPVGVSAGRASVAEVPLTARSTPGVAPAGKPPAASKRRKRAVWLVLQSGGLSVQNPAEVEVYITVKNTGKNSGTPTCTINLSSPGGAYTGFDGLTPENPIPAGGQESYTDTITVTNQGANYVTIAASSVSCS
jgi:hypothetical protein